MVTTPNKQLHILQVGDVLVSPDLFTERFCCDLSACHGACCVEGDAGAPVTIDEIAEMEDALDTVWPDLTPMAQAVIDRQGVAYADRDGDLVTSIVQGRDCVFAVSGNVDDGVGEGGGKKTPCTLCAFDCAFRDGKLRWQKPISCALYPLREKNFGNGVIGLNYHRWDICRPAVSLGQRLDLPLYRFLKAPLVRRFGEQWYAELCAVADELKRQGYI